MFDAEGKNVDGGADPPVELEEPIVESAWGFLSLLSHLVIFSKHTDQVIFVLQ